jgi:prepilin-type N-terminal cleavage/methylation domain-containing protein/prepilin-type processing-associated H-X9-DG protein
LTPLRTSRAFTLIEVLVVVAIIALLVAILLPSLGAARDQAQTVMCKTRLHELYNGHLFYANDNKQRFPHWDWWLWDGENSERQSNFYPGLYNRTNGVRPTDSSRWVEFGQIYRYVRDKEVYFCAKDSKRRPIWAIGGTNHGTKPIMSYVRFIEPNALALQHATNNTGAWPDDGALTSTDFLSPDHLKPGLFSPPLPRTGPSGPFTSTPDRVGLLFEEWPGVDDALHADAPQYADQTLNDGYSGFLWYENFIAARHKNMGHILYWDGHASLVDGRRFNYYPADRYAAIVAIGARK